MKRFSEIAAKIRLSAPLTEKNGDTELQMTFPEGSKGGFLLTSIPYDPGWKAKLDGTEISVIPVMQSLIGLEIPAGSKKLVLDFIPQGWLFGCTISIISLLVLLFFLIKLRLSQRTWKNRFDRFFYKTMI
jgi:uncharacterized membrane protein YfhO